MYIIVYTFDLIDVIDITSLLLIFLHNYKYWKKSCLVLYLYKIWNLVVFISETENTFSVVPFGFEYFSEKLISL